MTAFFQMAVLGCGLQYWAHLPSSPFSLLVLCSPCGCLLPASAQPGSGMLLFSEWGEHSDGLRPFAAFLSSWGCIRDPTVFATFRAIFSEDQEGMDSGERGQSTQGLVVATSLRKREKQTAGIPGLHSLYLPTRTSAPVMPEGTE